MAATLTTVNAVKYYSSMHVGGICFAKGIILKVAKHYRNCHNVELATVKHKRDNSKHIIVG